MVSKENDTAEGESRKLNKVGKCRSRTSKADSSLDYGADADGDQPSQVGASCREEKVSSLKTVSSTFSLQIYYPCEQIKS